MVINRLPGATASPRGCARSQTGARMLYKSFMHVVAKRRLIAILTLMGFLAGAFAPLLPEPAAAAQPCAMMMTHSAQDDGQPTKGAMPACAQEMTCLIAAALPAPFAPTAVPLVWQRVQYWDAPRLGHGRTVPPDYAPPIRRA